MSDVLGAVWNYLLLVLKLKCQRSGQSVMKVKWVNQLKLTD
jgi:hypothetical protein